jgi:para-nitrobenzyl esterase
LILGINRHDHFNQGAASKNFGWMDLADLRAYLEPHLGTKTSGIIDAYRMISPGATASSLLAEIVTDLDWRLPHIRIAEGRARGGGAPAYYFFSDYTSGPFSVLPLMFDHPMFDGFVGEDFGLEDYDGGRALAGQVSGAFGAFVNSGAPNHSGFPDWHGYSLARRETMVFDYNARVEPDYHGAQRQVMSALR